MSTYDITVSAPPSYDVLNQQNVAQYTISVTYAEGPRGLSVLTGHGAPDVSVGRDGEVYIDLDSTMLYGPKAAGVWPAGISLVGKTGQTGQTGPAGQVQAVVAGTNVTVDDTDPAHPIVSATGGSGGGSVDSVNGQTGAVVLTASTVGAATRNSAVFNVRDYGATGDGSTDDTAAVTAAAAAMVTAQYGVLYFPQGVYKVTHLPTFTPILTGEIRSLPYAVRGDGSTLTTILQYGTAQADSLTVNDPNFDPAVSSLGASVWSGFTLDGANATGDCSGIVWGDISGAQFDDVRVRNFTAADGFRFQQDHGWTEKVQMTRCEVANCANLFHFVNNGSYASWMYWTVQVDCYPALNQNVILDDANSSTHDGSTWRLTLNAAAGDGNTSVMINLPAANSWWGVVWDFSGETYGQGQPIIPIKMTTAAHFVGRGRFNAYYLGTSVIPTPLGWYFSFVGQLNLAGVTNTDGTGFVSVQAPVRRLVQSQPSGYTIGGSGVGFLNSTGSDILVTLPWVFPPSVSGAMQLAGPSTTPPSAAGAYVASVAPSSTVTQVGTLTYMHPADQYIRLDYPSGMQFGVPIVTVI